MAQNFNVRPYNDDFDETKHFYRVLFRPSVAVQARELTQAQSILQKQISFFGDAIYKHGAMVTPGQVATDAKTSFVCLQPTYGFLGLTPIPINLALFADQTIEGDQTGLKAHVLYSTPAENNDPPTLFVKYLNGGLNGEKQFSPSENLFITGTSTILAQTATANPGGYGITAQIDEGVYYINGFFVKVEKQYLVLNKFTNVVSTRVGLQVVESIITPEDDASLTDNALGSSNYAAPGAHRYKIDLILTQKDIDDTTQDENFVELLRLVNSVTQQAVTKTELSDIRKEFADRMSDANGNFAVRNFSIDVREHLDTSFVTKGTAASGTAVNGATPAKITLANTASAVDDAYKNLQIYLSNGTGAGQKFLITGYVGTTKVAALDADFAAHQIPDNTTEYVITDLTKVNRGIYPPPPFGPGDASMLAVGMESGRAYVDGYLVNTLTTTYVDVEKARDFAEATGSVIQMPIGNFAYVKNLFNIPLPSSSAPKDYLKVSISKTKATSSLSVNDVIGTARVHAIEFVQGTSQAATDAVFKMFMFDIKMNSGQDINTARSFFLTNNTTDNNNGNSQNAHGDICAQMSIANVNGTALVAGNIILGPSSIGTEKIVSYDPINNIILTEPNPAGGTQILTTGQLSVQGFASTTATLTNRTQLFDTTDVSLIYRLPQGLVKAVRGTDNTSHTVYFAREIFEAQRSGSGTYTFNSSSTTPFTFFNTADFAACIVESSNSADIGKFIDLNSYVNVGSFSGTPPNTTLTISIPSGLGSTPGAKIKLMATVVKSAQSEKIKTLTSASIAYPNPTAVMLLQKADIYKIDKILDSGNPGVDADPNNPAHVDIKDRYILDAGQRDYYYDVGSAVLMPNAPTPAGRVLIQFQYFLHSGTGDYFSVDSYTNQLAYSEIPIYKGSSGQFYPLRDCLDFRPRKANVFNDFSGTGGSYSDAVKPNSIVVLDYQYYLGRTDKIYVDAYGKFNLLEGHSSLTPTPPADPLDGMMLYTMKLNPYTLDTTDMNIVPTKNRRYTMHDIGQLEDRIANLEYYTSLNQLEQKTSTLQITDTKTGLDRFKNGFVVDTFQGHDVGNVFDVDYKCSVDPTVGIMRPRFVQDSNSLLFNTAVSSGYVKRSGVVMLPYQSKTLVEQKLATSTINVNPFAVFTWMGDIALDPPTDTWKSTTQRPVIQITDSSRLDGVKYMNQWSEITFGDWQTSWVGQPVTTSTQTTSGNNELTLNGHKLVSVFAFGGGHVYNDSVTGTPWADVVDGAQTVTGQRLTGTQTTVTQTQDIGQSRTGTQTMVTSKVGSQIISNQIVDQSVLPFIRCRRLKIVAKHFKPFTRLYPFFDGTDVSAYCRPFSDPDLTPSLSLTEQGTTKPGWVSEQIVWAGDFSPQDGTSVNEGISLLGDNGRSATYTVGSLNGPLMTDASGTATLFFEIPSNTTMKFKVGSRKFRLTDSGTNADDASTYGDTNYVAAGVLETNQETITSILEPTTITKSSSDNRVIQNSSTTTTGSVTTENVTLWIDPLAESFIVKNPGGVFISKIDVYFASIDSSVPITMQIRNMVNGYPGQSIVPFSEKALYPNNINMSAVDAMGQIPADRNTTSNSLRTSDDASLATTFEFDCPVYLNDSTEYCFVLIANSVKYKVYTAVLGQTVIGQQAVVSAVPYLGSLFKSQNASTWVADPAQSLKFTMYRAVFDPTQAGTVYMTNSSVLPNTLNPLPFQTADGSNVVRVYHRNHGMPKGQFSNSVVTFSNIAPGTYNGIDASKLTGTFSTDNVDLDSYTITVAGPAAVGTGRVGPDGVIATENLQYDSLCPVINTMTATGTDISWNVKTTTGKSPHNNSNAVQEPYQKATTFVPLPINSTTDFLAPQLIASDINESTNLVGASGFDRKSLVLQAVLSTTVDHLSPLIDTNRISVTTINNRIDDPTFANLTIPDMDATVTVTSTSADSLSFDSETLLSLIGVTGGQFTVSETVLGAVSGATGIVAAWDSVTLTLTNVTGTFRETEAVSGTAAIGTVEYVDSLNTITNPSGVLDFTVFKPGFSMTINGSPSNQFPINTPVTIIAVKGNIITVDTGSTNFIPVVGQSNVQLTQYGRFVAESGPDSCSTSARYITRQFTLQSEANSLHVYFTINRPLGSFVDCFFRVQKASSTDPFDLIPWTKMSLDSSVDDGESSNATEFKEYVYTSDHIGLFTAFSIKLVMRGGNSAQVPKVKDFRGIALAT